MKWLILFLLITINSWQSFGQSEPELIKFTTSECSQLEENYTLKIASKKWINDSTVLIRVELMTNCCYGDYFDIATRSDTLTLVYGPNFTVIEDPDEVEIEHCLCDCNFQFEYLITNIQQAYKIRMRIEAWDYNTAIIDELKR